MLGSGICSAAMNCQMSSSVQLLSGKARSCSPLRMRALSTSHGSGRWLRGSHRPWRSRNDKMRSLARALSSSRRPPPNAASKPCSMMASSNVTDCSRLRLARGPVSSTTRPLSIDSCTLATTSRAPTRCTNSSRYSMTSAKLCPVSTCITGNGNRAGANASTARCNSTAESLPPLNSSTGFSHSVATSRMIVTASSANDSRWGVAVAFIRAIRIRSWRCRPTGRRVDLRRQRRVGCTASSRSTDSRAR